MKKLFLICLVLFLCSCSPPTAEPIRVEVTKEVEVTRIVEVETEVEVTRVVEVEVVKEVEVTKIVEREVIVTATPLVERSEVFFELEGAGNEVTDNYSFPECQKAVFTWTAEGRGNFIVELCNADANDCRNQILESSPGKGEFLQGLLGGVYYFYVKSGPVEGWIIKGECLD